MKIEKTMLIGELIQMHELIPQMLMGRFPARFLPVLRILQPGSQL